MNNSLVNGNQTAGGLQTAGKGGGIANFAGILTLTNSTISNNSTESDGGGIYSTATVNSFFTTIAGNLADSGVAGAGTGGGITSVLGTFNLKASLLGQNYASAALNDGTFEDQQPVIAYRRNLVRNGDAEGAASSPNGAFVPVPGWHTSGQIMTAVHYNAPGGFPVVGSDPVPANYGDNFFAGGPSAGAGGAQIIDLSPLATSIDTGNIQYDFSADLEGYLNQGGQVSVEADFLDQSSHLLTQAILGPVSASDRGNLTGFLHRNATDLVPVNTRQVELFIIMTTVNGPYDDSYVDNILLVLTSKTVFLPLVSR